MNEIYKSQVYQAFDRLNRTQLFAVSKLLTSIHLSCLNRHLISNSLFLCLMLPDVINDLLFLSIIFALNHGSNYPQSAHIQPSINACKRSGIHHLASTNLCSLKLYDLAYTLLYRDGFPVFGSKTLTFEIELALKMDW